MRNPFVCLLCFLGYALPSLAAGNEDFPLRDFLGRTWRNEYVLFPLTKAQQKAAARERELVGPDQKAVAYQIVDSAAANQPRRIAFLADLDPFETRAYRFTEATARLSTDLKIEETDESIRITNRLTGISIRKTLTAGAGPPVGNTYVSEPTGEFAVVAGIWKNKDPQFASHMQWMHRQQGSFPRPGVGGFFPSLAGYRTLLSDATLPATAPAYRSELFPQTGLIAAVQRDRAITVVLYPRLKTQPPATFTTLGDGKVVKKQTETGTDYVFLGAERFTFKDDDIGFEGTSGSVQLRGGQPVLALGAAGSINAMGQSLTSDKPASTQPR